MAAQRGIEMLLEVDSDGSLTYQTIAGIRTTSFSMNKETVDITSQDDTNRYRQLIANAGVKSIDVTGSGVFKDAAADATARTYWAADTIRNWRLTIPSFYRIVVQMSVTSIEYAGEHNGEVTYSISLNSAADPAFTAL